MISIFDLVKKPKMPLSLRQVKQVRQWLDEDWEATDIDRNVTQLIDRLVRTILEAKD